ncbi:Zinc finger protein 639 [Fukomys damarensis]|uniref:Zinc finger protein 639 n=1 Tax=Fukomys damarensis TaxID=885580 RepID=A0A091DJM7_FUKDA|nr:Zinc finger protein 639 [Fukomys damarensis]
MWKWRVVVHGLEVRAQADERCGLWGGGGSMRVKVIVQTWGHYSIKTGVWCHSSEPSQVETYKVSLVKLQNFLKKLIKDLNQIVAEKWQECSAYADNWSCFPYAKSVHLHENGRDNPGGAMEDSSGRTTLVREAIYKGIVVLKILNVQPSDNGQYHCGFQHDSYSDTLTELKVTECSAYADNWSCFPYAKSVHLHENGRDNPGGAMEDSSGRTTLVREAIYKGIVVLKILNVQPSDNGQYHCGFQHDSYSDTLTELKVTVNHPTHKENPTEVHAAEDVPVAAEVHAISEDYDIETENNSSESLQDQAGEEPPTELCKVFDKSQALNVAAQQKWPLLRANSSGLYKCELCEFNSKYFSDSQQHMILKHKHTDSNVCRVCKESFSTNMLLNESAKLHEEDPSISKYCDYKTAILGNLSQHIADPTSVISCTGVSEQRDMQFSSSISRSTAVMNGTCVSS